MWAHNLLLEICTDRRTITYPCFDPSSNLASPMAWAGTSTRKQGWENAALLLWSQKSYGNFWPSGTKYMVYQTSKVRQGLGYLYLSWWAEFTGVNLTSLHSLLELEDVVIILFPTDHNKMSELPGYVIIWLRKPELPGYLISLLRKASFPLHVTTT